MNNIRENNKHRIQFDFSPEALKRIESIREKIEAPTKAEVIRNALKIYEYLLNEAKADYILEMKDKEGTIVFKIPANVLLS